jgi:hypothetical protein
LNFILYFFLLHINTADLEGIVGIDFDTVVEDIVVEDIVDIVVLEDFDSFVGIVVAVVGIVDSFADFANCIGFVGFDIAYFFGALYPSCFAPSRFYEQLVVRSTKRCCF